jgi:Uma2 family endonuclease
MVKTPIAPSGDVIASDIPFEQFLTQFDGQSVEWINGEVITMSPVSARHNELTTFLITLINFLLPQVGGGRIFHDPMVMRSRHDLPGRSPDIAIVLPGNYDIIQDNQLAGPADLVIEIVSPESHRRDRVEKFAEYEQGGVPEYWILDPIRQETLFYHRNAAGLYEPVEPDEQGIFHSRILPKLQLQAAIFWQEPLPRGPEIAAMVETMLQS